VYNFLLVINSNLSPIFEPFLRYGDLLAENRKFFPPLSFSALIRGDPCEFMEKFFTVPETTVFQSADAEDLVILACTVFD